MSENAITRRSFLAGSAGVAAVAAASGVLSLNAWDRADAAGTKDIQVDAVHSLCDACSARCGFSAYVVNGKLDKMIGDENHPSCEGSLCATGFGYASLAYSEDRLAHPMKRNGGKYEAISWDDAYREIAEKVRGIIDADGAGALAMVRDGGPTATYYSTRFLNALGSANVYDSDAVCSGSKGAGFNQVVGERDYECDIENSKMTLFLGRSYADAMNPARLHAMEKAHEAGAELVVVGARCPNSVAFADEWVALNPGTELAFVLAMANVIVSKGLYDADYIAANTVGFADWADYLRDCTPTWAEDITGVSKDTIERLASDLAHAAPAAAVDASWSDTGACGYANTGETARAVCCLNTLLGCWNKQGGAFFPPEFAPGELDAKKFPPVPEPEGTIVGQADYPLSIPEEGVGAYAIEQVKQGKIKGVFFCGSNAIADYPDPEYMADCLSNAELSVAIDVEMTETCRACDYVLPDTSYLELLEVPDFISGKTPAVSLNDEVIDKVLPDTRPIDQIFTELADACGVGKYFDFTVEELAEAQLGTVGLSLDGLRRAGGTARFTDREFAFDGKHTWKTPTGKIQFSSDACHDAGLPYVPEWKEPAVSADGESTFYLVGGVQPVHLHALSGNVPALMDIVKQYGLERVWINSQVAEKLGISEGDEVELASDAHTGRARAHVTSRINPKAVFLPSHYGCTSEDEKTAYGVGLRGADFVPFRIEPGYGGICTQEAAVSLRKVGA